MHKFAIFLVLAIHLPAWPQTRLALPPAPVKKTITLNDAINLALSQNEDIQIAAYQTDLARGTSRATLGVLLPELLVRGQYGFSLGTPREPAGGALQLAVPLLDASGIAKTIRSYVAVDQAESTAARTQDMTLLSVAHAYYQAVTDQRLVEVAQNQLERSTRVADQLGKRRKAGLSSNIDLQRANLQKIKAEEQVQVARARYELALGNLGQLIAVEEAFDVESPPMLVQSELDEAKLVEQAKSSRQDLKAQRHAVDMAERDKDSVWLQFVPTISAALQGSYDNLASTNSRQYALGGQALLLGTLNLYDGGKRYGHLDEASATLLSEKARLKRLDRQIALEIRGQLIGIHQRKIAFETAVKSLELAQQIYQNARNLYDAGHATSFEIFDAHADLFAAEVGVERARLDLDQAQLNLALAQGNLKDVLLVQTVEKVL